VAPKRDAGPDRVLCVSPHKATGGWQIAYVRGGKRKTEQRPTEDAANERAARLQLELAGKHVDVPAVAPLAGRSKAAGGWADLLWTLTAQAIESPSNDDLQRLIRCVAQAASAAAKHLDIEEDRARIKALEEAKGREQAARAANQGQDDAVSNEQTGQAGEAGAVLQ